MNNELSAVLRNKIAAAGLPFIDVLAGMATTVTTTDAGSEDGAPPVTKKFPVAFIHNQDPACTGKEFVLTPDSSRKSIIYFEDFGVTATGKVKGLNGFVSSLRLVCWLNQANLVGDHYQFVGGRIMATLIDLLTSGNPDNVDMFTRLQVDVAAIPPQDAGLFGRYTYNEPDRQYLRPPFQFFGIDLRCKYFVPSKCLNNISWSTVSCT